MAILKGISRCQVAVVGNDEGGIVLSLEAPVPELAHDIVLIRSKAVSVNPVDAKMTGSYVTPGAISGCDVAGIVEAVGSDAAGHDIKVGDRVSAIVMGMNPIEPSLGAFAEIVGCRAEVGLLKLPNSVSYESGCALGTSFMTAGLALFKSLELPGYPLTPSDKCLPVLVYGGSTATGTAAIQLLRIAGFAPVVTCSTQNFELVRSYGAEAVFDYRQPDCAAQIKAHTRNGLRYALDCITTTESMQLCYAALGRAGGRYTALDPYPKSVASTRKMVRPSWVMGPIMLGRDIGWPAPHHRPADLEMFEFGMKWRDTLQELLNRGLIRAHPLSVRPGGLTGVLDAMEEIKAKKVSGVKLVYTLST